MRTIRVAAAIIKKDKKILIAERKKGEFAGLFEFPGGKIENGETEREAIIREIKEELEVTVNVESHFMNVIHQYPTFTIDMACFICTIENDNIKLNDHSSIRWINPSEDEIHWVPADIEVINKIRERGI